MAKPEKQDPKKMAGYETGTLSVVIRTAGNRILSFNGRAIVCRSRRLVALRNE